MRWRAIAQLSLGLAIVLVGALGAAPTRDASAGSVAVGPPPEQAGPDFLIPPPQPPEISSVPGAPTSTQTSEFMAGTIAYTVVFVESSGGTGNCSPADAQTENWDAGRQATVLTEISDGLSFWPARTNRPSQLTFVLDNQGTRATSCEPINRPSAGPATDEPMWVADVLTSMGFPATTANYYSVARTAADSRRTALGTDWGYLIFVVDSLNDPDGSFSNASSAYAYLNGPFMVLTYDNDGWGISRMHLVAAHETGHIFGALDEYAVSGCTTADSWGYLNAANSSCNNGGDTGDISVMGEGSELDNPSVDVSSSARAALGWRNPVSGVVDVVRTSTVSLTPYLPDPSGDNTPTYSAVGGNTPFPPEGPRMYQGFNVGTVSPVTVSKVAGAEWNLDGGAFTSVGVVSSDGVFDEETEAYTFTPASGPEETHTFGTQAMNNFGHASSIATDSLTISCEDNDGLTRAEESAIGTDPCNSDTDGDGCKDGQELGPNQLLGGRRDPLNPWDYFNPSHDGKIRVDDILIVLAHFGKNQGDLGYSVDYDRTAPGPNLWNLGPPDGMVRVADILTIVAQFGHDCS